MQFCTLGAPTLQIELGDVDCAWCNTYIHVRIPPRVLHFSAFIIFIFSIISLLQFFIQARETLRHVHLHHCTKVCDNSSKHISLRESAASDLTQQDFSLFVVGLPSCRNVLSNLNF